MKVEILANRTKFVAAVLLSVVLTISGILMAFFPENFSWLPLGEQHKLVLGITISLIFAVVVIFGFIKLKEDKVAVTIDDNGITDHIGGMSIGTMRWEDITGFGEDSQVGNKFVVIYLNNVDELMDGQSKIKRALLQQQINSFGSPAAIGSSMLQGGYKELKAAIEAEGAKRDLHFRTK